MGPAVLPVVCALLLGPAAMRLLALAPRHARGPDDLVPPLADADLPVYSVLIPLRDEDQMVPLLERAMSNLDYPPEKLDIKFVVEAKSTATVRAVEMLLGDLRFELVSVPDAIPRTKPKALNYALPFVRGSCVVVYDAEDIPDSDQLRLAAARFAADQGVDCLQAELVVDNAHETWLTALFAGEYAGQFGVMLPALTRWHLPVPLGGTSNHFRAGALRELGGWDAFNVTEDADLGVRLARLRYRTGMLASETREEAPISLAAWSAQRTRWMKGWMQTLIVHNQNPWRLYQDIGWRGFIAFEIYTGSMILAPLLHTLFLGGLAVRVLFGPVPALLNGNYLSLADIVILVVGYASAAGLVVRGLVRRKQGHLVGYQFALPLYWVLHSAATVRAAIELLVRPYFWDKTAHGRTRLARSFARNRNRNERAGS